MGFLITTDGALGNTQVPNDIILNYIMKASGENVKVYLYLLMASQNPTITGQVSVESLADVFDLTERDIVRSLRYWEREGLMSLIGDDSHIEGVSLRSWGAQGTVPSAPARNFTETGTPHLKVVTPEQRQFDQSNNIDNSPAEKALPEKIEYTPMQIEALAKDAEMSRTLAGVEQALGATLTSAHMQLVMYLICDLGFSSDLVIYLYELAAGRSKTKPRYIETIAINWAKKGIDSVEKAQAESNDFSGKYRPVATALGIHRDFAPAEKEIIDSWDEYGFTTDIIEEACARCVLQSGDTNLNYVGKILEGWHKQGVENISDITKVDEVFKKNKKTARGQSKPRARMSANSFQNFRQRDYSDEDYEDMERQFLQRKGTP